MNEAGLSDEQLSAELKKWTGVTPALHPVGELLDRHWEAAFAYARLCTDGPRAAGMLTTAAFTRLFGASLRQAGPTAAWRPPVLVAVRRIAAEWDTDGRQELLHPALRSAATGERAAARLLPPPARRLLSRAFQRVPQISRAVLWHTLVEAEPLAVPAALLGLDEEEARVELGRARERLREECLQAHRELAPEAECQRYLRLLDVTFRRGGIEMDPDLRGHLDRCTHCRRTAGQLDAFNTGLGLPLAEAVLGWGARAYVESRARRAEEPAAPAPDPASMTPPPSGEAFLSTEPTDGDDPAEAARRRRFAEATRRRESLRSARRPGPGDTGATRPHDSTGPARRRRVAARTGSATPGTPADPDGSAPSRRSALRAARRARRRNLALAVGTVSALVVLPLVLWSVLGSGDGPAPRGSGASSPAPGKGAPSPGASWAGASAAGQGALHGRLHNLASGLCVGVVGGKAVKGAETQLAPCGASPGEQWTYETDGRLRNSAAPDLCLDSSLGYSVRLAPCSATGSAARNIRYDFTLQGVLVPRWNQELALTPAATDGSGALVTKDRATGADQRWSVDTAKPELQMQIVNWDSRSAPSPAVTPRPTTPGATPAPRASRAPSPPAPALPHTTAAPTPTPDPCSASPYYCGWGGGGYGGGGGWHRR
ncbi:ricin-type beta-trefoil lectin domain protein [Streptomyces sp. FXJ1.172]|uniref:ricin-type beta-trefoil lectin domain protein n=1 Tax=Streptomyces sp. FXJ1.172 TaxID=710705 RepID=UPI0007CF5715|nr:ricin-type beta-trefoil lectin domain protein [Streptomyces sp. FXJ1.172]WEO93814.1 ricin-type beta-trefoil lectin domain protein [Streptomyces sp. FXJ1.172]